ARAADHHPAALAVRERSVDLVLDDVEDVEEARPFKRLHLVVLEDALARRRVEPQDLDSILNQPQPSPWQPRRPTRRAIPSAVLRCRSPVTPCPRRLLARRATGCGCRRCS